MLDMPDRFIIVVAVVVTSFVTETSLKCSEYDHVLMTAQKMRRPLYIEG